MKVMYQIETLSNGIWRESCRELRDGCLHMEEHLKQRPGKHRFKTLYAILTEWDETAMPDAYLERTPFSSDVLRIHFDGYVYLHTENGMCYVPYLVSDADCYQTGAGSTLNIPEILRQLEDFRQKHKHDSASSADWTIRTCQAIVAHAGGYESRVQWSESLTRKPDTLYVLMETVWENGLPSSRMVCSSWRHSDCYRAMETLWHTKGESLFNQIDNSIDTQELNKDFAFISTTACDPDRYSWDIYPIVLPQNDE